MANSTIEKLIEAGMQFSEMSKKQADSFVSRLVKAGDLQRQEAERITQLIIDRGRETSERLAATVQSAVERESVRLNDRIEELESQLVDLAERVGAPIPARSKKAPAKKTAAKKTAAKKAPAKKSAAKKAVGSSGVAKVATSRPS